MIRGLIDPEGKTNLHTHTDLCDGKSPAEDTIRTALGRGFRVLGFSGHGYAPYDLDCCMSPENERLYRSRITALKRKYEGRIDIRLGVERGAFTEESIRESGGTPDPFEYDYVIGSVHYVREDGVYYSIDTSPEETARIIRDVFRGDEKAYVRAYYQTEAEVLRRTDADIVGHFDLIRVFNQGGRFFDDTADWYREAALDALHTLCEYPARPRDGIRDILGAGPRPVFEINTGGVAKGKTDRPYPDRFLIEELERLGCPLILSSDCHDANLIDFGFRELLAGE